MNGNLSIDRGTLSSEIEVCVYILNKKPIAEIYFRGSMEPFCCVDCGVLFGELLRSHIAITDDILDNGSVDIDFIFNEHFGDNNFIRKIVAKFVYEGEANYPDHFQNILEVLITAWNTMYYDEFKELCFIKDVIEYCEDKLILLDIEHLQYFMDLAMVKLPQRRLITLCSEDQYGKQGDWLSEWKYQYEHKDLFDSYYNGLQNTKNYVYSMDSVPELTLTLLYEIIKNGYLLKRCAFCDRWFVPTKSDEKYCTRIINDKTCKEKASYKIRSETYNSNPNKKKYNSVNTALANRANKSNISETERELLLKDLYKFRDDAIVWKEQVRTGEKSDKDFSEWLDSFKTGRIKAVKEKKV